MLLNIGDVSNMKLTLKRFFQLFLKGQTDDIKMSNSHFQRFPRKALIKTGFNPRQLSRQKAAD